MILMILKSFSDDDLWVAFRCLLCRGWYHMCHRCPSSNFKFIDVSMSSGCSSRRCCFFFYFLWDDTSDTVPFDVVATVAVAAFVVASVVCAFAAVVTVVGFVGEVFPFSGYLCPSLLFVRVDPSFWVGLISCCCCCYCCCCCCFCCCWFSWCSFGGLLRAKWPSCLQVQYWGLLPSTTTIITWSSHSITISCAVPLDDFAEITSYTSYTPPYSLWRATRTSPFNCIGTLHTVTLILRLPLYSGWSRKNFYEMLFPASFTASSSGGSRTSQVAKPHRAGIPADSNSSSKVSLLIPANLLVFMSVTTKDWVWGWTTSTSSSIGKILFPWKYFAYLPTRSFSWSSGDFSFAVPKRRLALLALSELAGSKD